MLKSVEARIAALEAQSAPTDNAPRVIFLKGLRPGEDETPHSYASTGHVRLAHEDEQAFMKRIRLAIESPDKVQLVVLSDEPEWPQHAE